MSVGTIDRFYSLEEGGSFTILTLVTLWSLEALGLVVVADTFYLLTGKSSYNSDVLVPMAT